MKTKESFQSYFDELAQTYTLTQRLSDSCVTSIAKRILNQIPHERFSPIVDVGCGDAYLSSLLLSNSDSGRCFLVDISGPMLEKARQRLSALRVLDRVQFVRASAEALPLRSCSAAVVLMAFVLHLLPEAPSALNDVRRILAPGALFFLTTYDPKDLESQIYSMYFPGYRKIDSQRFVRVAHLSRLLASRGFRDIIVSKFSYKIQFESVDKVVRVAKTRPFSGLANYSDKDLCQSLKTFKSNLRQCFGAGEVIDESKVTLLSMIKRP